MRVVRSPWLLVVLLAVVIAGLVILASSFHWPVWQA
jgi:hypothetical protein